MTDTINHAALPINYQLRDYQLIDVLGSGAFGIVYLAEHIHLRTKVSIKEFIPDFAIRKDKTLVYPRTSGEDTNNFEWGLNAFLNEAKTLATFKHNHIVGIQDFFETNNTAYMVMEYIVGTPLDIILKNKTKLNELETKNILIPLLDGLKAVHANNIFHRDIKPGNIIIKENGEPVLIDFGAAREQMGEKTRTIMFTPGYGAYEQYQSKGNTGPWTDIYALAATIYHCLTGKMPAEATDRVRNDPLQAISKLIPNGSNGFYSAIEEGLSVFEDQRPQTVDEWEEKLLRTDEATILNTDKEKLLSSATKEFSSIDDVDQKLVNAIYEMNIDKVKKCLTNGANPNVKMPQFGGISLLEYLNKRDGNREAQLFNRVASITLNIYGAKY